MICQEVIWNNGPELNASRSAEVGQYILVGYNFEAVNWVLGWVTYLPWLGSGLTKVIQRRGTPTKAYICTHVPSGSEHPLFSPLASIWIFREIYLQTESSSRGHLLRGWTV